MTADQQTFQIAEAADYARASVKTTYRAIKHDELKASQPSPLPDSNEGPLPYRAWVGKWVQTRDGNGLGMGIAWTGKSGRSSFGRSHVLKLFSRRTFSWKAAGRAAQVLKRPLEAWVFLGLIMMSGMMTALAAIIHVLRFQAKRIRELPDERATA